MTHQQVIPDDDLVAPLPSHASSRSQGILGVTLALAGLAAYLWLYPQSPVLNPAVSYNVGKFESDTLRERLLLAICVAAALIPRTRSVIFDALIAIRRCSARTQWRTAVAIFVLSPLILLMMALARGRVLLPYWHDECFYCLQTTFLAHGKLAMPSHPLADFFDVPYVFVRPVYASSYFVGTSLLHVPAVWLHLPYCVLPLLIAAGTMTLVYWIICEIIDPLAGLLAVVLMLSLEVFRWTALIEMSHPAGLLWELIIFVCWLKWRKKPSLKCATLAGAAGGWYLITRPFDALAVLAPIALVWLWEMRRLPRRMIFATIALASVAATPFIVLQLFADRAVTGHFLQSPLSLYYRQMFNDRGIGLEHFDPAFVPPTASLLLRDTYAIFVRPHIEQFQTMHDLVRQALTDRLPETLGVGLPTLLLIVLTPLSLLNASDIRRKVLLAIYVTYTLALAAVLQFHDHYVLAIVPSIVAAALLGAQFVERSFSGFKGMAVFIYLAIFLLAAHRILLNDQDAYQALGPNVMRAAYLEIPQRVKQPAIVLFRYHPQEPRPGFNLEPVYNWEVLWPDDAGIIRATDLGSRNHELFDYYAKRQPDRTVYLYDRREKSLKELGNVRDLAK